MPEITEKTAMVLKPRGKASTNEFYFLYTRKRDGLWTSLTMGALYLLLVVVTIWQEEYVLFGTVVLLVLLLIYDQVTNKQFLEMDDKILSYHLPKGKINSIEIDLVDEMALDGEYLKAKMKDGSEELIPLNAMLSAKKREEFRQLIAEHYVSLP